MEGILEGTATRRLVFIVSSSKSAQFSSPSSVQCSLREVSCFEDF